MDTPPPHGGPTFVRVVSVGRRMQDGWRQVDRGGPFKRFLAGVAVLLLAVPILIVAVFAILTIVALGIASALVTWVLGGGSGPGMGRGKGPERPTDREAGRENVRVIPPSK
ncbi:MAG: hypothetical protein CMJ34_09205 [Phycisphaerae bacterium]|nr:hypothetical protein [Phycisphaerae bacterium]